MNITQKQLDEHSLQVRIAVEKADYEEKVKKALQQYRREADIKGFRKGMAPMGIIQKLYGGRALLNEVNGVVSEGLTKYIEDNKIQIIGEPLPSEEQEERNNFEESEHFVFDFDLMLAPEINIDLTAITVPSYKVSVTESEETEYLNNILRQYGELQDIPSIQEEDFIKVDLTQPQGLDVKDSYLSLRNVPQEFHEMFLGKAVGDVIEVGDITALCPNETDRASLLRIKKEELSGVAPAFTLTVKEAKRFVNAEEGQPLYDKIFGEGKVTGHDAFMEEVRKKMDAEFMQESHYRLARDVRETLVEAAGVTLPEKQIKRWLYEGNEGKFTMEQIDKEYPLFVKDFTWQLICQKIRKEQNIVIQKEGVMNNARRMAAYQLAMYGLPNVPEEQLDKYAQTLLDNEKEGRRIYENVEQDKVMDYLHTQIKLVETPISLADLRAKNQETR